VVVGIALVVAAVIADGGKQQVDQLNVGEIPPLPVHFEMILAKKTRKAVSQ
jgi:hypothetical protein